MSRDRQGDNRLRNGVVGGGAARVSCSGLVCRLFVAPAAGAPMVSVPSVSAVAGRGLQGDRYFRGGRTQLNHLGRMTEVTLVDFEVLEVLRCEHGLTVHPRDTRRNIITQGVSLNALVAREFRVGPAILRGVSVCEPCAHLERVTRPGVLRALVHRAGLRARIVEGGTIRVGDLIGEVRAEDAVT
jgi:MOSC domain-containing protein YiiM